jgi:hypothetical protein
VALSGNRPALRKYEIIEAIDRHKESWRAAN